MDASTITLIRKYINDTTTPYTFTDEEIETIYSNMSSNFYLTIAELWLIKSGMVSESNVTSMSLANESYSFKDSYQTCIDNYKLYLQKSNNSQAQLFEGCANTDDVEDTKYSNLMGGNYPAEPYNVEEE